MRGAEDQQIPILRNQLENRWKEVEKNLKEALQAELGPKKKKVLKTIKEKSSEVEEENLEQEEEVEIQSSSSKEKPALGKRKNLDQPSLQKSPKKKKSHAPEK
jgi:predicted phage gp36 major capsid-like protein